MKTLLIILCVLLGLIAALLLIAVVRTLLTPAKKSEYAPPPPDDEARMLAEKLSAMVRCETVSSPGQTDLTAFAELQAAMEKLFPLVHQKLEKTVIDGNLLFRWKGTGDGQPILLMSHQDVVPAAGAWTHEPFGGEISPDGKIWGRGTADTKGSVMAFFQAVENLLEADYTPACDVYLASSCTEEWGGGGAPKLVAELKRRGVELFLLCDEGGAIINEPVGGIHGNFAMVGVFEKGKANVRFTARGAGGHASAPSKNTPAARVAAFIHSMETYPPFKKKFSPEVTAMFGRLAPYAPFGLRLVLGNLWLFGPILKPVMTSISAQAGAMLQTTAAFTVLSGSEAYNVLPQEASVGVNMRFIPHQGEQESLALIRTRAAKFGLETEVLLSNDFSPPVDIHGPAFQQVERVIGETFPGLPVSPYVMTGATDAYFYQDICKSCIRFAPILFGPEQMKGMHGLDECVEISCLPGAVRFYENLIRAQEQR